MIKRRLHNWLFLFLLFATYQIQAQKASMDDFSFTADVIATGQGWHSIELPADALSQVRKDCGDIRIYKKSNGEEVPYLIRLLKPLNQLSSIPFEMLNESTGQGNNYFTLKTSEKNTINKIELKLENENFDWKVNLQGSHDQKSWVDVLTDYRILNIRSDATSFQHTNLHFPDSNYEYYKIAIQSPVKVNLERATLASHKVIPAHYLDYKIQDLKTEQIAKTQKTKIDIALENRVPIGNITFDIATKGDFYRTANVQYLVDSVQTDKGWKRNYRTVSWGSLNSFEPHEISFDTLWAQHLLVTINNKDNNPLKIGKLGVRGPSHRLIADLEHGVEYTVAYGNKKVYAPRYDLVHFKEKIPEKPLNARLSPPSTNGNKSTPEDGQNGMQSKWWMWGILMAIIALLGWFSFKMLSEKQKEENIDS